MSDAMASIIVSVVTFIGVFFGVYAGIRKSSILTAYRLEQLEATVKESNAVQSAKDDAVVARVVCLEKTAVVTEERFKVVNHRLNDLETKKT